MILKVRSQSVRALKPVVCLKGVVHVCLHRIGQSCRRVRLLIGQRHTALRKRGANEGLVAEATRYQRMWLDYPRLSAAWDFAFKGKLRHCWWTFDSLQFGLRQLRCESYKGRGCDRAQSRARAVQKLLPSKPRTVRQSMVASMPLKW